MTWVQLNLKECKNLKIHLFRSYPDHSKNLASPVALAIFSFQKDNFVNVFHWMNFSLKYRLIHLYSSWAAVENCFDTHAYWIRYCLQKNIIPNCISIGGIEIYFYTKLPKPSAIKMKVDVLVPSSRNLQQQQYEIPHTTIGTTSQWPIPCF